MDILKNFPYDNYTKYTTDYEKIANIFAYIQNIISKIGNEQSGGMGFPNFDKEIEIIFKKLDIKEKIDNMEYLNTHIKILMNWINNSTERGGEVSYYVTFNLGLGIGNIARHTIKSTINHFMNSDIMRPNIIFKIKTKINYNKNDKNYDMFLLAMQSSAKKMIPTYILFDSKVNKSYDPNKVAIMGCRTKVVEDIFGSSSSIGRINLDYITINLPRISLEIDSKNAALNKKEKIAIFKDEFRKLSLFVKDILINRYNRLLQLSINEFPNNAIFNLQLKDFNKCTLEEIFKHGTLSIGFIGLSEALEILTKEDYYDNDVLALEIMEYMRNVIDSIKEEEKLNFTLLASSGEYISGRFPKIDKALFKHKCLDKGFYTNSFHVEVTKKISIIQKIRFEGPFHKYTNGGSITYVEFSSAPISNIEAILEAIDEAILSGVSYIGINFPFDKCADCGMTGTFDICLSCKSNNIIRIRRVSGYLEILDCFVNGKKNEEKNRVAHQQYS